MKNRRNKTSNQKIRTCFLLFYGSWPCWKNCVNFNLDWWWRTSGWTTADQVMRFSHSDCTKSLYVFVARQGHFPFKMQIYVWWWPLLTGQLVTDVFAVSWVLLQYPPLFGTLLLFQKKYSVLNCRKQINKN